MRRSLAVACVVCALVVSGAVPVNAMIIFDGGSSPHRHRPDPGHALKVQTGILASPTPTPSPRPSPTSIVPVSAYPSGVLTADQVASYARQAGFEAGYI